MTEKKAETEVTSARKGKEGKGEKAEKIDLNKKEVRKEILEGYNRRGRGRSDAEKKESYRKYRANKKKAVELEARNFSHLVLFPASDVDTNKQKFYNMGGNSAIIYVHEIAPRIKRKPTLRIDMDHGEDKFPSGVCSIADLEALKTKLLEIGIKQDTRVLKGYEDFVIFKLNREYQRSEIREMLREEQKRLDSLNKLLYAQVLYPDIHKQILELKKIIPTKVKNMDKTYREVIGMKMIDTLMDLVETYTQMAHGDLDEYEAGRKMLLKFDMILAEVSMMNELKLWEVSTSMRVGDIVVGAERLVKGKIINKKKNKAEKKEEDGAEEDVKREAEKDEAKE